MSRRRRRRPALQARQPPDDSSRFPWLRRMSRSEQVFAAVVAAFVAGGFSLLAIVLSSGNSSMAHSSPSSRPGTASRAVVAGKLAITESSSAYMLVLPVFGSPHSGQQVKRLTLEVKWGDVATGCEGFIYTYKLDPKVLVAKGRKTAQGSVLVQSGTASGSNIQAMGSLHEDCDSGDLILSFTPPALLLTGQTTTVSVSIPKRLIATYLKVTTAVSKTTMEEKRGQLKTDPLHIADPGENTSRAPFSYVVAKLFGRTTGGAELSGCAELHGLQAQAGAYCL